MPLFSYFEPLIQYVTTQQSEGFAKTDFTAFNAVVTNLINDLDKHAEKIDAQSFSLAKLAVFSLVDEMVQRSNWQNKGQWQQQLLQERYLSTANAGESFFSTLANLNERDFDVIRVYYRCLILGFRGKYYRPEDIIEIRKAEQACLFLMGITASVNDTENEKIFPTLYASLKAKPLVMGEQVSKKWYQNKFILWGAPIVILFIIYFFFYGILHLTISNYIALLV